MLMSPQTWMDSEESISTATALSRPPLPGQSQQPPPPTPTSPQPPPSSQPHTPAMASPAFRAKPKLVWLIGSCAIRPQRDPHPDCQSLGKLNFSQLLGRSSQAPTASAPPLPGGGRVWGHPSSYTWVVQQRSVNLCEEPQFPPPFYPRICGASSSSSLPRAVPWGRGLEDRHWQVAALWVT